MAKAPNYDWLADLTVVQKKYIEETYRDFWQTYRTYGYSVVAHDFCREMDEVYTTVTSQRIVQHVELPKKFEDKVYEFYKKQAEALQLKEIVVPVQNYHVLLVTTDQRLATELSKSIKHVPVVCEEAVDERVLDSGCVAIVFDDVTDKVMLQTLEACERKAVPYIRRSIAGWTEPYLTKDAENIIYNFVERSKPCKRIR